jgi:RNA-binding protein
VSEIIVALAAHELVKVKILENCLLDRNEAAFELAAVSGAEVAQVLGRTILLYKQGKDPKIELPK